ncbi:ribosomal protein L4 [Lentinus tigrinus ALCF2SS1-7]|uniref:Large ribosomal subunit protein uL4m n=1 Tax=Lentinus tigrinus ALCF2SS1-6 TaxID=1328759 RepID=A0A5C2RXN6_9APHY|nr:ribosomal protein L4 [Lentinus tigrinus ALCF2SS1-6]RPD82463.1 ribosomal protein L4 [Lentinus tigrinus ALCF2SS1-7]
MSATAMLATIRRALGQTSRIASRRLSTVVASAPPENALLASEVLPAISQTSAPLVGSDESGPVSLAFAGARPLYLQLSSLIRPEENVDPSDELVELDPHVFAHPIRRDILHLCVVHHLDCQRQGSANTKTRGEVRGSGHKIRPQKGSGRARLGDAQSPMLRGGGVAFGPKPRDFATKLNRKVIQMGMRVALSARLKEHSLGVVKSLEWPGFKTSELQRRIEELGWKRTLFVTGQEEIPDGLRRAGSNLLGVDMVTAEELNVYSALKWPRLVLDLQAVEWFERALGRPSSVPPHEYGL